MANPKQAKPESTTLESRLWPGTRGTKTEGPPGSPHYVGDSAESAEKNIAEPAEESPEQNTTKTNSSEKADTVPGPIPEEPDKVEEQQGGASAPRGGDTWLQPLTFAVNSNCDWWAKAGWHIGAKFYQKASTNMCLRFFSAPPPSGRHLYGSMSVAQKVGTYIFEVLELGEAKAKEKKNGRRFTRHFLSARIATPDFIREKNHDVEHVYINVSTDKNNEGELVAYWLNYAKLGGVGKGNPPQGTASHKWQEKETQQILDSLPKGALRQQQALLESYQKMHDLQAVDPANMHVSENTRKRQTTCLKTWQVKLEHKEAENTEAQVEELRRLTSNHSAPSPAIDVKCQHCGKLSTDGCQCQAQETTQREMTCAQKIEAAWVRRQLNAKTRKPTSATHRDCAQDKNDTPGDTELLAT